jgi:hypothetical protein
VARIQNRHSESAGFCHGIPNSQPAGPSVAPTLNPARAEISRRMKPQPPRARNAFPGHPTTPARTTPATPAGSKAPNPAERGAAFSEGRRGVYRLRACPRPDAPPLVAARFWKTGSGRPGSRATSDGRAPAREFFSPRRKPPRAAGHGGRPPVGRPSRDPDPDHGLPPPPARPVCALCTRTTRAIEPVEHPARVQTCTPAIFRPAGSKSGKAGSVQLPGRHGLQPPM